MLPASPYLFPACEYGTAPSARHFPCLDGSWVCPELQQDTAVGSESGVSSWGRCLNGKELSDIGNLPVVRPCCLRCGLRRRKKSVNLFS